MGGVTELVVAHMWPLALLVLMASIIVPLFKLVALFTMLVMTGEGSVTRLRERTGGSTASWTASAAGR